MNAEKSSILVPAAPGTPFEGGFYGGQIRIGASLFAVVWAPKAEGELKGIWRNSYDDVPGARSYADSIANTVAMAEAGSELAKKALAIIINEKSDWCLPARDVLELAYRHLKPTAEENYAHRSGDNPSSVPAGYPYTEEMPGQTAVSAFREGGPEAFADSWYWSSTQYSSLTAWIQRFLYGGQLSYYKKFEARARLVRLIQLNP